MKNLKKFFTILLIVIVGFFLLKNLAVVILYFYRWAQKTEYGYYYWLAFGIAVNLICFLGSSYWGYKLAQRQGRNKIKWAILCLILSIWGVLYLYITGKNKNS